LEVAEGGGEAGSLGLEGLGSDGRLVGAMGGGAQPEGAGRQDPTEDSDSRRGRRHAERLHDGVWQVWSRNEASGFAVARADAPGGREADAERLSALIKALTGKRPRVYRRSDGVVMIECYEEHLEGFMRFAELAGVIARWLEETRIAVHRAF